ncbi:MAG: cytochrome c, partial [Actinobacteria bacterium]|nr:cytochrome c [Actinomycetota bacterium]
TGTDLSAGQELFVGNCAPCHGATANGGAAGRDALAPSLYASVPLDIAEAMITGPGEMPVFGFTEEEQNDIAGFVSHLQTETAPGGADIGGIGPVPEGFVGWIAGMGTLTAVCYLIGRKKRSVGEAE